MRRSLLFKNEALTIVELTVVLVIIGILLSAVAIGLNVKKSSDLQGYIIDVQQFQVAVESFNQKYSDFPGDIPDASSYWGAECATLASDCDGDGDGEIDLSATANDNESFRFWQHLSLSGLIEGFYSGVGTGDGDQADIGINIPAASSIKVGYSVLFGKLTGTKKRNEIRLGSFKANEMATAAAFSGQDAYNIDYKADDGQPDDGIVTAAEGTGTAAGACVSSGEYQSSSDTVSCVLALPVRP